MCQTQRCTPPWSDWAVSQHSLKYGWAKASDAVMRSEAFHRNIDATRSLRCSSFGYIYSTFAQKRVDCCSHHRVDGSDVCYQSTDPKTCIVWGWCELSPSSGWSRYERARQSSRLCVSNSGASAWWDAPFGLNGQLSREYWTPFLKATKIERAVKQQKTVCLVCEVGVAEADPHACIENVLTPSNKKKQHNWQQVHSELTSTAP